MVKTLYGVKGGIGSNLRPNLRGTVWGKICRINDDLLGIGLDLDSLMFEKDQTNHNGGPRWVWGLEANNIFS